MIKSNRQSLKYIVSDYLFSALGWALFFFFRRLRLDNIEVVDLSALRPDTNFYLGIVFVPLFWLLMFQLSGYYKNVVRRSRFNEFIQTFLSVAFGSLILFFALLLDDAVKGYSTYYLSLLALFSIQFFSVYIPRSLITNHIKKGISHGKNRFRTLIIGCGEELNVAMKMLPEYLGNVVIGTVCPGSENSHSNSNDLPCFGDLEALDQILTEHKVDEVILANGQSDDSSIRFVVNVLFRHNIFIKTTPTVAEKLIGSAKLSPIYGTEFMEVKHELMPPFEENLKRVFDVAIACFFLTFLSPVYLFLAIRVKIDSKGPVFYKQERVGKDSAPFKILKFRTMVDGAENGNGPQLTLPEDNRVTRFGKTMRKFRLDEFPQFWNVLKGDMSVVGPRPERKFFIEQIVKKDPNYYALQKVRPGVTSLGMVKYGYADTVDKMVERMKYDIIYLENMSILLDLKIFFYTIKTIFTGKGV